MKPEWFRESNRTLVGVAGDTKPLTLRPLVVHADGWQTVSRWRLSWRERFALLFGCPLWLIVWSGDSQPPVCLTVEYPFTTPAEGGTGGER